MYLIGHVGLALGLLAVWEHRNRDVRHSRKLYVGVGSMLPDLIDKPIGSIFFGRGRWFGHSIIFLSLLFLTAFLIKRDASPRMRLLYLGSLVHLLGDGESITLKNILWPFLGPIPPMERGTFLLAALKPSTWVTEFIGLVILTTIGVSEGWNQKTWLWSAASVVAYILTLLIAIVVLL